MKLRLGLKLTAALLCALPLSGAVIAFGAPAASAATCSGFNCAGHDPFRYSCGYYTSTSATAAGGGHALATLTNWYGHCNANWSQGLLTSYARSQGDSFIITIDTVDSRGNYEFMCYPGPDNTGQLQENCSGATYGGSATAWTDMVDGTKVTYSVIYVYDRNGNQIAQASTSQ